MKLRQREYCHNCDQYVIFEFEDTTDRQIIYCPNCGHEHYRELDEGTIVNIRINPDCREIVYAKLPPMTVASEVCPNDYIDPADIEPLEVKRVIGTDENGCAIVEGTGRKVISNRRWGRDPRQG